MVEVIFGGGDCLVEAEEVGTGGVCENVELKEF